MRFMQQTLILVGILMASISCSQGSPGQNARDAEAFLSANASKPGVVTTASGLQYQVLAEGQGDQPGPKDTVSVNYQGSFLSGKTFDSGEHIAFPLKGVIPGWTEGLQLMKTGAKFRFFIPPALAYGERGAGRLIEPNSALIFDVELLEIRK